MADRVLLVGGEEIGQDSDQEEFYRRAAALIGDFFQLKYQRPQNPTVCGWVDDPPRSLVG